MVVSNHDGFDDDVKFRCLLCKEFLSAKLDNNFSEHMKWHNIKFNQEFIFSSFFLSHKGIEKTVEFILNFSEAEAQAGERSGGSGVTDVTRDEEMIVPDTPTFRDDQISVDPPVNNLTEPELEYRLTDMEDPGAGLLEVHSNPDNVTEEDARPDIKKREAGVASLEPSTEEISNPPCDQTQDEDLIETWNLWNEDEVERSRAVIKRSSKQDEEDDDEDDDPDFTWASAVKKRTIR